MNDYSYMQKWDKAFQSQFLMFKEEVISLEVVRRIILAITKSYPSNIREELFSDCLGHIMNVQETFNRKEMAAGKKYNVKGYIRTAMINYACRASKVNSVIQSGPLRSGHGNYYICKFLSGLEYEDFHGAEEVIIKLSCNNNQEKTLAAKKEISLIKNFIKKTKLNSKEKFFIKKRFYSEDKTTRNEIGKELGVSRETIRIIENEALDKLKKTFISNGL